MKKRIENLSKFKKLFWEADVTAVDLDEHDHYLIERILEYGDIQEVKWMFEHYNKAKIKEVLCRRRGLSKKSLFFWKMVLGD